MKKTLISALGERHEAEPVAPQPSESDVSKTDELIADLEAVFKSMQDERFSDGPVEWETRLKVEKVLRKAADALVASARVPVQGEGKRLIPEFRADLVEAARERIQTVWTDAPEGVDAETLAQNIVSAQEFFWLSHALPVRGEPKRKVPHTGPGHAYGDAAYCEGCLAEQEVVRGEPSDDREALQRAVSEAVYGDEKQTLGTERVVNNLLAAGFSCAVVPDAATAALARTRAIHVQVNTPPNGGYCTTCTGQADLEVSWPCPTIAALDGAPEPEGDSK